MLVDPPRVVSPDLDEISGVAVSRRHPDVLWVHNDSGAPPELFAVGPGGEHLGRYQVEGAEAVDWEDLTIGPGPDGRDHLWVADLGDNTDQPLRLDRPIRVYRVPEPEVPGDGGDHRTEPALAIPLAYEDGPRDVETLMHDPRTGDVVVVSKQWDGTPAGVYVIPAEVASAEAAPATPVTLPRVAEVAGSAGTFVTAGEVSPDGSLVALRTYLEVWLWDRSPGRSVAETLAEEPTCRTLVLERQGEAVAFALDGRGFVTISEGTHPAIRWHRLG